jgi:hypothetical protein
MNVTMPAATHIPPSLPQTLPVQKPSGNTTATPPTPTTPSNPSHLGNTIDTTA